MAREIRKSPASRDPRTWLWLPVGFATGAVPPLKWRIETTGVTSYFQRLNSPGLVLPIYQNNGNSVWYRIWDFYPSGPIWELFVSGWPDLQPGPTDYTNEFHLLIQFPGHTDPAELTIRAELSVANQIRHGRLKNPFGANHPDFPNEVTITPLPWWVPDSP